AAARVEADHQRDALALVEVVRCGRRCQEAGGEEKPDRPERAHCASQTASTTVAPAPLWEGAAMSVEFVATRDTASQTRINRPSAERPSSPRRTRAYGPRRDQPQPCCNVRRRYRC